MYIFNWALFAFLWRAKELNYLLFRKINIVPPTCASHVLRNNVKLGNNVA